jgi:replicative DNA helicase
MATFTRDFQVGLLTNLLTNRRFFEDTVSYLRLTDFTIPACRLIYETLRDYHQRYRQVPDFRMLFLHLQFKLQNPDGQTETVLAPEEFEALKITLGMIAATPKEQLNAEYFRGQLHDYLATVRTAQKHETYAAALMQGQSTNEYIQEIVKINEELAQHTGSDYELHGHSDRLHTMLDRSTFTRVPVGVRKINKFIGGGLGVHEAGMITACPGVGKTTGLLNFGNAAVLHGYRVLFLTLELAEYRVAHRFQAMHAEIPAQWYKVPVLEWPLELQRRYSWIMDPNNPYANYMYFADMSKRQPTIADIDSVMGRWKVEIERRYGREAREQCCLCCVDWLDIIDPSGLRFTRNTRDDQILTRVNEELAALGRKHDVAMWTATQATRDADGREVLALKHTAQGYHKNDPLDVSLGLAPINQVDQPDAITHIRDDDDEEAPVCDRLLNITIMKNRDNPPGINAPVYQGSTLRLWNNRHEADTAQEAVKAQDTAALNQYYIQQGTTT